MPLECCDKELVRQHDCVIACIFVHQQHGKVERYHSLLSICSSRKRRQLWVQKWQIDKPVIASIVVWSPHFLGDTLCSRQEPGAIIAFFPTMVIAVVFRWNCDHNAVVPLAKLFFVINPAAIKVWHFIFFSLCFMLSHWRLSLVNTCVFHSAK